MVGNYGVANGRSESTGTHAKAVLMREARGPEWTDWSERGLVALTGIDTRSLVLRLREARPCAGGGRIARAGRRARRDPLPAHDAGAALVAHVSTHTPYVYAEAGSIRVAVVDYGCKRSILRRPPPRGPR